MVIEIEREVTEETSKKSRIGRGFIFLAYLGKITLTVTNQQTGFPTATIADDDNLLGVGGTFCHLGRRRLSTCRHAHHGADGAVAGSCASGVSPAGC